MGSRSGRPGLIVTRTPGRISFAGGGTDLPDFYQRSPGAVLSSAIDKYLYVTVKRHGDLFNERFRLNYSETEQVSHLEEIRNEIARECLRLLEVRPPIYISTVSDLPEFSGLGSSSSFAVGLLHALHSLLGERVSAGQLAEEAAYVEIEALNRPVGKQDHYAAAFGGLNYLSFAADGAVAIEPQRLSDADIDRLFDHIMMFWTGIVRDAGSVLAEQKSNTPANMSHLGVMRDHADELRGILQNGFDPRAVASVLDANWQLKRRLASTITSERIDTWYKRAMDAGASGGKLCGAGGGGFLLFVVAQESQDSVRAVLSDLTEIQARYEAHGSRVLVAE